MKWFREHKKATILIVLLLALCLMIVFSFTTKDSTSPVGRFVQSGMAFLEEPLTHTVDGIRDGIVGIFRFRSVMRDNEILTAEVQRLNQELIRYQLLEEDLAELKQLSDLLHYQGLQESKKFVTADVIAMDGSDWFNYYTINVGTDDGVPKDAIAINGDGLVGRVIDVGSGWSKVVSIIDESNQVSFKVLRDMQLIGICSGDGSGSLEGFMLDVNDAVIEGDTLITTGIGLYPEGIVIGKVDKIIWDEDMLIKRLTIEPSVQFKSVRKISVIIPF